MPVRLACTGHGRLALLAAAAVGAALAALMGGCGNSDPLVPPTGAGSLAVTVNWPAPEGVSSAAIPAAAQSVGVTLSNQNGWSAQAAIARPVAGGAATLTVDGVPAGAVHIHFGAYSGPPITGRAGALVPSGDLLAWETADETIVAGEAKSVEFMLRVVPDHVVVSAAGASTTLAMGQDLQLYATAYDADNNVLAASGCQWSATANQVVTVSDAGLVHAQLPGDATVSATVAGMTGGIGVTVLPPPRVSVVADPGTVRLGMSTTLTWTAYDATSVVTSNFGATTVSGTTVVWPTSPTTYTITVAGVGGQATGEVDVAVSGANFVAGQQGGARP
jgi:hypothetical protein